MRSIGCKICGCLALICAIGLVVAVRTSSARSAVPLSESEMSSVYGGCDTHCDYTGSEACPHGSSQTCAERFDPGNPSTCSGYYIDSCRQKEKGCLNDGGNPCDDRPEEPCPGTYDKYRCGLNATEDECIDTLVDPGLDCHRGGTETFQWCETIT